MANINLARPTGQTTPVISCSVFGTGGTDFFMKVTRARIRFEQDVEKTTGDGDDAPVYEVNYFMTTRATLFGFVVAQAVDTSLTLLSSFLNSSKNPLTATWNIKLASSYVLKMTKVVIPVMEIGYERDRGKIPLMMSIIGTDTHATLATTTSA
jgi:hypothetical protein